MFEKACTVKFQEHIYIYRDGFYLKSVGRSVARIDTGQAGMQGQGVARPRSLKRRVFTTPSQLNKLDAVPCVVSSQLTTTFRDILQIQSSESNM